MRWFRVFSAAATPVGPAALLERLHQAGFAVAGHFRGDDLGWFRAELLHAEDEPAVVLDRYLTAEEDLRDELSSWAAWLETMNQPALMERMIGTVQLFTLHAEDGDADSEDVEALGVACCGILAGMTDGIYQIDGRGFFAADGNLLVAEEP